MGRPVTYFEVGGRDRAVLAEFYAALFDWGVEETEHDVQVDTNAGVGIDGHLVSLGHEPHTYTMFYVDVEDIDESLERATALGGRTLAGPLPIPDGRFAWISDPEGNTVGLVETAPP